MKETKKSEEMYSRKKKQKTKLRDYGLTERKWTTLEKKNCAQIFKVRHSYALLSRSPRYAAYGLYCGCHMLSLMRFSRLLLHTKKVHVHHNHTIS